MNSLIKNMREIVVKMDKYGLNKENASKVLDKVLKLILMGYVLKKSIYKNEPDF